MGCMMSDSSSDDDVSDYEMLKRKVRGTKKRLVAVKADQIYQARKIYKMTKIIDDLKNIIDDLKAKVEARPPNN
ncbi:unnamed protein product [Urochloa humidicola]